MNWTELLTEIKNHPEHTIAFRWTEDYVIRNGYHLTEIKMVAVNSVDCGGTMNAWREIVLQLWIPDDMQAQEVLTAKKFLQITSTVEALMPLDGHLPVKIEFGNTEHETRQVAIASVTTNERELLFTTAPELPQCKALDRGESCGPIKPKIKLSDLQNKGCTPSSGCC